MVVKYVRGITEVSLLVVNLFVRTDMPFLALSEYLGYVSHPILMSVCRCICCSEPSQLYVITEKKKQQTPPPFFNYTALFAVVATPQ